MGALGASDFWRDWRAEVIIASKRWPLLGLAIGERKRHPHRAILQLPAEPITLAQTQGVTHSLGHGDLPLGGEGEAGFASPEPPGPPARTNRLSKGGRPDSSIPREAAKVALRQPNRRCGPLSEATTAQILGLLDFQGPADLASWLAGNA